MAARPVNTITRMSSRTTSAEPRSGPPLRIAVVETAAYGGLLHYAFQLADGLARGGDEVDLIVPRGNELAGRPSAARLQAILAPPVSPGASPVTGRPRRLARQAGVALRLVAAWTRIVWRATRGGYDVVLLTGDLGVAPAAAGALALTHAPGAPPVTHVGHNARTFNRRGGEAVTAGTPLTETLLTRFMHRCAVVFVHGERTRAELEETRGKLRTAIVPHGDEAVFAKSPAPPATEDRALFFGTWTRYKGLEVLMEAFDLVLERMPQAKLTIAGEASSREVDVGAIEAWAAARGNSIEIIEGYIPMEDVPGLFARSRALVAPYVLGYQSGVIHIAMTMGRAVVATDVGDLGTAVVDGETGFVVPPSDPPAFADALERVLADPELAQRLGEEGRRRVETHSSWDEVAALVRASLAEAAGPA